MKFVKQNLTLLICALVVVLSIVSIFYPFGSLLAEQQKTAQDRFTYMSGNVDSILNTTLVVPGATTMKGVATPNIRTAKEQANKKLAQQADEINKSGSDYNRRGRVDSKNNLIPLLDGKAEQNFLPKILPDAVPMQFKQDYQNLFDRWMLKLVGSNASPYPPRKEDLTAQFSALLKARDAARPPGPGGSSVASTPSPTEVLNFERGKVMETAMNIHMYVDPGAFQVRQWAQSDNPPNEQNIFESLVDTWFIGDVVNAIAMVNDNAYQNASQKNVGLSAIKRLSHIAVGNDALISRLGQSVNLLTAGQSIPGTSATLFYQPLGSATPSPDPSAAPGTSPPNNIDLTRSMTGRASGSDYDVVLMQINLDIDPAYLNKFIDALYRQNMGYTVMKVKTKTVDPLDRASNGYIYGNTQVVEVEIVVEGLLFRTWTQPIMPDPIRTQLGLALVDAAAAPK